jgi:hypothetical protein
VPMIVAEMTPPNSIREHISTAGARSTDETRQLAQRLLDHCWPGGADRTDPVARRGPANWHPIRLGAAIPVCGCASGRCDVCN